MALDKLSPLAAPPGTGLTDEPGRWPWEKPPVYSDPDDAIDYLEERISEEATEESMMKMLLAGITIEELVDQVAFKWFMAGFYSPDVAELAKVPLAAVILDIAEEANVPVTIFSSSPKDQELEKDINKINLLRETNPEMLSAIEQGVNQEVQQREVEEQDKSFIKMEK